MMEMGLIRWDLLFTFDPIVGYDFVRERRFSPKEGKNGSISMKG